MILREFVFACLVGLAATTSTKPPALKTVNATKDVPRTSDLIRRYGYPAEEHLVQTEDGYRLNIFRIPHSRNNTDRNRPVVLLQHGIILNSDSWVFRGPEEDLVFLLSDAGYDVWMSNSRGTDYSRHEKYTDLEAQFWNYGLTETGAYDMAAVIDYVLAETGRRNLTYVGHSRGNAMLVILLSSRPEYNDKVNLYIGLAPVIYSKEAKSPFFSLASRGPYSLTSSTSVQKFLERAKVNNIFRMNRGMRRILDAMCDPFSILRNFCSSFLFLINGDDLPMYNRSLTPIIFSHFTMGMSAKEFVHLLQVRESDKFRPFNYDKGRNLKVYGEEEPAEFPIENVRVPAYLYYGPNDLFVSERDIYKFARRLPNLMGMYRIPFSKFNHIDYMWAKISNVLLYPHVVNVINAYNTDRIAS